MVVANGFISLVRAEKGHSNFQTTKFVVKMLAMKLAEQEMTSLLPDF